MREIANGSLEFEWNVGKRTVNDAVIQNRSLTIESSFKIGFKYIITTS